MYLRKWMEDFRKSRSEQGLCSECGSERPKCGSTMCESCIARATVNRRKARDRAKKERLEEVNRAWRESATKCEVLIKGNLMMLAYNGELAEGCKDHRTLLERVLPPDWASQMPIEAVRLTYPVKWPLTGGHGILEYPEEWSEGWLEGFYEKYGGPPPLKLEGTGQFRWGSPLEDTYLLLSYALSSSSYFIRYRGHEKKRTEKLFNALKDMNSWLEGHRDALLGEHHELQKEAEALISLASRWCDSNGY